MAAASRNQDQDALSYFIEDAVSSHKASPADRGQTHSSRHDTFEISVAESKAEAITTACDSQDVFSLMKLAVSEGGLLKDELRQRAWPILLGSHKGAEVSDTKFLPSATGHVSAHWKGLPKHRDEEQVDRDVNRSFVFYPTNLSERELETRKDELSEVIVGTLRRYPQLCYFQGFHDIIQVLLLVLGVELSYSASPYLSLLRLRDFMLPSLSPSLAHLHLLPAILYSVDRELHTHVSGVQPFFALASTLTLYAHEVRDFCDIARLFDFFLAQEVAIVVYFFAVIILSRKRELLDIPVNEPEMIHFTLSKLPHPLNLERLISHTVDLFASHPPHRLPFGVWRRVSPDSVLKTTRKATKGQIDTIRPQYDLSEAQTCFRRQVMQLSRQEIRQQIITLAWNHRRMIIGVGSALLVGGISIWLRRYSAASDGFQQFKGTLHRFGVLT